MGLAFTVKNFGDSGRFVRDNEGFQKHGKKSGGEKGFNNINFSFQIILTKQICPKMTIFFFFFFKDFFFL